MKEALKLQLEEEIWELFSWQEGQFKFEHRTDIDTSNILVEIDIEPLLIEGSRRQDEWAKIVKNIPSDDIILRIEPLPELFHNELTLSENEWLILSLVNGFYDMGSIIDRTGLGKFETYRVLHTFLSTGLIKVKPLEKAEDDLDSHLALSGEAHSLEGIRPLESGPDEGPAPSRGQRKGIGGIFSRNKPIRETTTTIQLDFISPLGAMAFFVNSLYEGLQNYKEFIGSQSNGVYILRSLWRELLMHYPKADMIGITNGKISVKPLETIIQWENSISKLLSECFDESFAALAQLTKHLFQNAVDRLGDKTATRTTSGVLTDFGANIRYKHNDSFEFRSWVQDLLKI